MPNLQYKREDGTMGTLRYDRVLCDVPCSGDGTLRKGPFIKDVRMEGERGLAQRQT